MRTVRLQKFWVGFVYYSRIEGLSFTRAEVEFVMKWAVSCELVQQTKVDSFYLGSSQTAVNSCVCTIALFLLQVINIIGLDSPAFSNHHGTSKSYVNEDNEGIAC